MLSMPKDLSLDNPIAIVGNEDVVLGFRALGFRVYAVESPQAFKTALIEITQNKTGICLIQEDIYLAGQDEIENYKYLAFPVFIPFAKTIQTNLLDNLVKAMRLKATGAF